MTTLNLAYPGKSQIEFKVSIFPDGQLQITILKNHQTGYYTYDKASGVEIKSRINNFRDLEYIICATQSLRNLGVTDIHLYVPYFLGSRSDRQFEDGSNNYLKQVICPIINSMNFKSVTVLDPHSDVLEACLNNFKKESNLQLMRFVLTPPIYEPNTEDNFILISPDAGATKKIYKLAEQIGYKDEIITCSKDRDNDGKLSRVIVPEPNNWGNKDLIIVDDICDGGNTFINIAKEIKLRRNNKIYLVVTHGIFSQGYLELWKKFAGIYCTNSYKDINDSEAIMGTEKKVTTLVKQLDIF